MVDQMLTASGLTTLLIEAIKWLYRKYVVKDMSYDFPVLFYALANPLLNAVMPFVLVYGLGMFSTDPILSMDWMGVVRYLLQVAIGALVSMVAYDSGLKKLKDYNKELSMGQ